MDNELVLYYGLDNAQKKILKSILDEIRIDCREIYANQNSCTISSLLDKDNQFNQNDDYKFTGAEESVAILRGLSDKRVNQFLAAIRAAEGLTIQLKAVVTEHNINWKFSDLLDELRQENAIMKVYMAVRSQIKTVRQWLSDENLKQSTAPSIVRWRQEIAKAADAAQNVIILGERSGEMDLESLKNSYRILAELMNNTSAK